MMNNKKILTVFAFTVLSVCVFGQSSFTGNWKLKELKSIAGPKYGNAMPTEINVQFTKDSMLLNSVSMGQGGNVTSHLSFSLDGKSYSFVSYSLHRKIERSYKLSDEKQIITLTTVYAIEGNQNETDFTRVETWTIENGQLVINKKSIETRSETWEVKGVFEKVK